MRASTNANGTPNSTHSTVLASDVFRLSFNAAVDDGLEISDPNCGQSTFATIAAKGSMTNIAPTAAGR
ncbi:hypothetical protein GCM10009632_49020 [Mycolicibacterium alvei]|uniref:Uncharacterized protein n=1 Tax=Mycolicibacterium alvei TaxID=67081 RepID=A0A6N4UNR0_9MYCO|nr:hypothetical protein MALV_06280 [Mycolicibacterium alvei]